MREAGPNPDARSACPSEAEDTQLSGVLSAIAGDASKERLAVGDLLEGFGNRAYGMLIFIFAAPNAIPIPLPGLSAVLGAPLLLLAWQFMWGRPRPWFPERICRRSIGREEFARMVGRVLPWLRRLERLVRPRLLWVTSPVGKRLTGVAGCVFALSIFLPLPFGNMLPGLGLAFVALGLLERDGVAVLAGMVVGTLGLMLVAAALLGLTAGAYLLVQETLGS